MPSLHVANIIFFWSCKSHFIANFTRFGSVFFVHVGAYLLWTKRTNEEHLLTARLTRNKNTNSWIQVVHIEANSWNIITKLDSVKRIVLEKTQWNQYCSNFRPIVLTIVLRKSLKSCIVPIVLSFSGYEASFAFSLSFAAYRHLTLSSQQKRRETVHFLLLSIF